MEPPTDDSGAEADASQRAEPLSARSFEQSIQRLGAIVESLEAGEQPLEESLRLFEEGMALVRRSQTMLDTAEQRIEQLLGVGQDGALATRELSVDVD